jgi:hypothetical protein
LGFDGITLTKHHAPLMTCPSPHLLLAAAAVRTSRIRLGTAVTVLPLYSPIRVAGRVSPGRPLTEPDLRYPHQTHGLPRQLPQPSASSSLKG